MAFPPALLHIALYLCTLSACYQTLASLPHPGPKIYTYHVVAEYPHDHNAFTQGLEHDMVCNDAAQQCQDIFWESTGLYRQSTVRKVSLADGKVFQQQQLEGRFFAEGLTRMNNTLYQLTWRGPEGFMYSTADLAPLGSFRTDLSDGWGLTNDGTHLIATDSSHVVHWIDPKTFKTVRKLAVRHGDIHLPWLNELEYINGELWANIWQTECIARINLTTGYVTHWILLHGLRDKLLQRPTTKQHQVDVLNGIAWDSRTKRLFVTGKMWPAIFEVVPKEFPPGQAPSMQHVHMKCHPHLG